MPAWVFRGAAPFVGGPACITADVVGALAGGNVGKGVTADVPAGEVGGYKLVVEGLAVKVVFDKVDTMGGSLAVARDDDGAAIVFVL